MLEHCFQGRALFWGSCFCCASILPEILRSTFSCDNGSSWFYKTPFPPATFYNCCPKHLLHQKPFAPHNIFAPKPFTPHTWTKTAKAHVVPSHEYVVPFSWVDQTASQDKKNQTKEHCVNITPMNTISRMSQVRQGDQPVGLHTEEEFKISVHLEPELVLSRLVTYCLKKAQWKDTSKIWEWKCLSRKIPGLVLYHDLYIIDCTFWGIFTASQTHKRQ